jgi:hypothetical protein
MAEVAQYLPLLLKVGWTALIFLILYIYWREYGPENFLWFSDLALIGLCLALWFESPLLVGMVAVGTLAVEIAWIIDFISGGRFGLASYMFDSTRPLWLRAISSFHILIPLLTVGMLTALGYDRHSLIAQTLFAWVILTVTYLLTTPSKNINWVFGLAGKPQQKLPPILYLGLMMIGLPLLVYLPTHLILVELFPAPA